MMQVAHLLIHFLSMSLPVQSPEGVYPLGLFLSVS